MNLKTFLLQHKRAVIVLTLIALLLIFFFFNPTHSAIAPKCFFKMLTGYDCPGCGAQRSLHALLHGHLAQAVSYNYFYVIAMPYFLLIVLCDWVLKGNTQQRFRRIFESHTALTLYIALYLIWWLLRNILHL